MGWGRGTEAGINNGALVWELQEDLRHHLQRLYFPDKETESHRNEVASPESCSSGPAPHRSPHPRAPHVEVNVPAQGLGRQCRLAPSLGRELWGLGGTEWGYFYHR